jgi:phosphate transport system ATP-binding protein
VVIVTDLPAGITLEHLSAGFAGHAVLRNVNLRAAAGRVTALIGPSGCGKSTVLRCINRLHELDAHAWTRGRVCIGDPTGAAASVDAYAPDVNPARLRRRVGMVFQRPTPFVTDTVFDNVAIGIRAHEPRVPQRELEARVESAIRRAGLWREVADRLFTKAAVLSGGQQQRLCIARALAVHPEVLLLDEPTASLDPVATQRIEELLYDLRGSVTMLLVTHNLQQAARISDATAVLLDGAVVEHAPTRQLFTRPADPRAEAYITGRFG